jgi:hypothetical protein
MEGVFIVQDNNQEDIEHQCTFNKVNIKHKSKKKIPQLSDTYSSDIIIKNISDSKKCRLKINYNSKPYFFHFLHFPQVSTGYIIEVVKKNGYINMRVSLNIFENDIKGVIITIN